MSNFFNKFNPINSNGLENEKPHILNRIISALIDACIVFLAFTGIYSLIINTPMADTMYKYYDEMTVIQDSYLYNYGLGVKDYDISKEEYSSYRVYKDEDGKEYVITGIDVPTDSDPQEVRDEYVANYNKYHEAIEKDASYANASTFSKLHNYGFVCLSALISEGIFYLAIPLIDKKSRTIGKMFAKSKVVSTRTYKRPKWYQILGSFSWKLIVESLVPFVFLNEVTFFATAIVQFTFMIINTDNRALHDLVSQTMVVIDTEQIDKKSTK